MLVLSRKVGERILIGDGIVVTVVRIGPNSVRLGVAADKGLKILRDELEQPRKIQPDESDIADLGRRNLDPLGVADAYCREV